MRGLRAGEGVMCRFSLLLATMVCVATATLWALLLLVVAVGGGGGGRRRAAAPLRLVHDGRLLRHVAAPPPSPAGTSRLPETGHSTSSKKASAKKGT